MSEEMLSSIRQKFKQLIAWKKTANPQRWDIFRKHIQEADRGAEGQRKVVFDRKSNADSCKDNGKSGCGVVIKGVDRERLVMISRIAVPLKIGTAVAAEMTDVCVLTGIPDLVFHKCLCVQNIIRCIDTIMNKQ